MGKVAFQLVDLSTGTLITGVILRLGAMISLLWKENLFTYPKD